MTDVTADALRIPIAASVMTRRAQGAGRFTFGLVSLTALALKLYEFGTQSNWAFLEDFSSQGAVHWAQWIRLGILVLEALATAAVISVAVTYVVVNSTVNHHNNNNTTVTNYNGQDLGQVITVIGTQLAEVRDRISVFEQHLVRTEESERQRMREFLSFAETERVKQQAAQLADDKRRFDDISESLKKVVEVLNRP